jgi:glutamate dehydrogenase
MERVLATNPRATEHLCRLFSTQFDPTLSDQARRRQHARVVRELQRDLSGVARLDEDRILRAFWAAIEATLRTNYFQPAADGSGPKPYLALKLDPRRVPGVPEPRPMFEIWVHAPRFEGVHLRKGKVARGGLRWSDRYEDFRTEILGLMKAQHVKNTLIVPVGAKGGFVCRRLPSARDAQLSEVTACYQQFVRGLLDLTDNVVGGQVTPPANTVRRDADDPYLVVAADKGTATFSDVANAIAAEYRFWLGDAFASGGSAGYDHKKIAITARGAWECVKRHFHELGLDAERQPFTVIGIGDMSGDVFGNGLLRSRHARLVAAFNHQHIFIDPDPDARRSFRERERLFALPRSTWADYDRTTLSRGGGVWSRADKSIRLSPEARTLLELPGDSATPNEVIQAILRLRVDLLWNGGIGTYVKASDESHADVGDRANDAVRVNGREVRARVVGEGGNLGLSQRGRVEYALSGGRLNTDFIDNSGGVNCSDVEVNIKILLRLAEERRHLKRAARDRLLARMTDAVSELVLRNNYLQSQALSLLETRAAAKADEHAHAIRLLEREADLNRHLEFLPDDGTLAARASQGRGLTRPELSILLSYSKIWLYHQVIESDLPEDPYLSRELVRYFPAEITERYGDLVHHHPLRREIIATATTNSVVNRMGPVFAMRLAEDTGATIGAITRAYAIARESTAMRDLWAAIEALDPRVAADVQYQMHATTARALKHATLWLLANQGHRLKVEETVERLRPGLATLLQLAPSLARGALAEQLAKLRRGYVSVGVPSALADRVAALELLQASLYMVDLGRRSKTPLAKIARVYLAVGDRLGLDGMRLYFASLPAQTRWQSIARDALREDLYSLHTKIAERVLTDVRAEPGHAVERWLAARGGAVTHLERILSDLPPPAEGSFPILAVALEALGRVATT